MNSVILTTGVEHRIVSHASSSRMHRAAAGVAVLFAAIWTFWFVSESARAADLVGVRQWKVEGEPKPIKGSVIGLVETQVILFTPETRTMSFDISKFSEADQAVIRAEVQKLAAAKRVKVKKSIETGKPITEQEARERAEAEKKKHQPVHMNPVGPNAPGLPAANGQSTEKAWHFPEADYRQWRVRGEAIEARLRFIEADEIVLETKDGTQIVLSRVGLASEDTTYLNGVLQQARMTLQAKRLRPRQLDRPAPRPPVETPESSEARRKTLEIIGLAEAAIDKFNAGPDEASCAAVDELFARARREGCTTDRGDMLLARLYGMVLRDGEEERQKGDDAWNALFDRLNKWHDLQPKSNAALIAQADAWVSFAWRARGSGLAITVPPEKMLLFEERLKRARTCVEDAIEIADDDPQAYYLQALIGRGLGDSKKQMLKYVARSMEISPDYYYVYCMMVEYLRPRWHGGPGDQLKFANWLLKKLGPERGPMMYAHAAMLIVMDSDSTEFDNYQQDALDKGARQLSARMPESPEAYLFAVYLAYLRDDRSAIPPIPSTFNWDIMSSSVGDTRVLKSWLDSPSRESRDVRKLRLGNNWATQVAFSPDGAQLVATCADTLTRSENLTVWNFQENRRVDHLRSAALRADSSNNIGWSRDGRVLFIATGGHLVGWKPGRANETYVKADMPPAKMLRVSADGSRAVMLHSDEVFRVWNAESGEYLREFSIGAPARSYYISSDGKTALLLDETPVLQLWDTDEGKVIKSIEKVNLPELSETKAPGCSGSLERLLLWSQNRPLIYDVGRNAPIASLREHADRVAISPSGEWVATSGDQIATDTMLDGITLRSAQTGKIVCVWDLPHTVSTLEFSPDSRILAATSRDGCVRIYDVPKSADQK